MYQVAIGWRWGIDSPLVRPPRWTWGDCNGGENDEKNNGKNEGIWYKTMGKEGKMMENDEKNNGKMREYDVKQWEKNGKGGENDEKNNGKNERLWYKTMEKMGKQWKIWVERLENWYARKNGGKNRERVKWCQVKLRLRCGTIIA